VAPLFRILRGERMGKKISVPALRRDEKSLVGKKRECRQREKRRPNRRCLACAGNGGYWPLCPVWTRTKRPGWKRVRPVRGNSRQ